MSLDICPTPQNVQHPESMNPDVNDGLCMLMMCQWRFISCNKCTTVVGVLPTGEAVGEGKGIWEISPSHSIWL